VNRNRRLAVSRDFAVRQPTFYGWWMVTACLVVAVLAWGLGLFGASVYLHEISRAHGWSIGLISSAITLFFLIGAVSSTFVGSAVATYGPRWVTGCGAVALAAGVAGVGQVNAPWQVYAAFAVIGLGWAGLSTTAITTTLAPWFERYQGRAVSTALMGASIGGMVSVPTLFLAVDRLGFANAMLAAAAIALIVLLPLALLVLKHRPQDIGLAPDGAAGGAGPPPPAHPGWTRRAACRTAAFWSVVVTFGLGLLVQIGFITHHVALVAPVAGTAGASAAVSAAAIAAFLGRVALARYADRIDVRVTAGAVLLVAAASLSTMALMPSPAVLIGASAVYGLTIGNITTLSPIVVRREFGAASFGTIYGMAGTGIGLISALGPSFFGLLHEVFGGYRTPLLIAAVVDVLSAAVVVAGGRVPLAQPTAPAYRTADGARDG
jgi:MFS family permease